MRISKRFIQSLLTSAAWWAGVVVSFLVYLAIDQMIESKVKAEFDYGVNDAQRMIQTRVQSYMDVLRGVSALFHANDEISREQFHTYVKELDIEKSFPGITNLNVARHVFAREKKAFESSVQTDTSMDQQGHPDFSITPPGKRAEYHVLTYLEPMASNRVSFGRDIASVEPVAQALAFSRDSGQLHSSGRLIHIQGPYQHIGLAMRMPLYHRHLPLDTVAERRAAYYGSIGAGFDVNKLMLGALDQKTLRHMRLKIYDAGRIGSRDEADTTNPEQLLFDSDVAVPHQSRLALPAQASAVFSKRISMTVGPRIWEIEFLAGKSAMREGVNAYLSWFVLAGNLLATLLLYSIYYSLMSARRRAAELANDMTKDLRASEASLAQAQHMAHLGSWLLEPASGKMTWSAEMYNIFGMEPFSDTPQYEDFLRRLYPQDRERVRKGLEQSLGSGEEFNAEHRILQNDGSIRWVQIVARASHNDGTLLLRGTIMDFTERKRIEQALQRSQNLLRKLTAHQNRIKEEERKRIAREIHDELGQTLLALRIDVAMLDTRTGKSHPRLNERTRDVLNHIDATVKSIRGIINNLRPAVLDLGLAAAIEWQVAEFRRRNGIACDLIMGEKEFTGNDALATSLFRVLQESLTNVVRHANANRVVITLCEEHDKLVMKITDNGVGIDPDDRKTTNSFGLIGIEERIHALNGEFIIDSAPGNGTTLTISIPLESSEPAQSLSQ